MCDKTVSSIPRQANWPVSFPQQSIVELISAWGLLPETIVSRLSKQLGGRIAHSVDSYEKISTPWNHIEILNRGYKPSWIGKAPRKRAAACNPYISALASNTLNMDIQGLLVKEAIFMVGLLYGQYAGLYFTVSRSKRSPDN